MVRSVNSMPVFTTVKYHQAVTPQNSAMNFKGEKKLTNPVKDPNKIGYWRAAFSRLTYSQAAKGGYIVAGSDENPDVILVATGSEVSTLVAGAELLRKDGKKVRIVSVPSEGLFRQQSKEYQLSVLPREVKKFGLTAGLPVNLLGLVPEAEGTIWGLESFGFSAPYKVLDEKLGYTAENVYTQVNKLF